MIGLFEFASISVASSMSFGLAAGALANCFDGTRLTSASSSSELADRDTKTGPVGGLDASLNALRNYRRVLLGVRYFGAPLCIGLGHLGQVAAPLRQLANVLVTGRHHERGAGVVRVDQEGETVGQAVVYVKADERRLTGGPCVGVGHADGDGLLHGQYVLELRIVLE